MTKLHSNHRQNSNHHHNKLLLLVGPLPHLPPRCSYCPHMQQTYNPERTPTPRCDDMRRHWSQNSPSIPTGRDGLQWHGPRVHAAPVYASSAGLDETSGIFDCLSLVTLRLANPNPKRKRKKEEKGKKKKKAIEYLGKIRVTFVHVVELGPLETGEVSCCSS